MPLLLLFELGVSVRMRMRLMIVEFSRGPGEVVEALSEVDEVLKVTLLEGLRASTLFNILNMFERVRGRLPQSSIAIEVALAYGIKHAFTINIHCLAPACKNRLLKHKSDVSVWDALIAL